MKYIRKYINEDYIGSYDSGIEDQTVDDIIDKFAKKQERKRILKDTAQSLYTEITSFYELMQDGSFTDQDHPTPTLYREALKNLLNSVIFRHTLRIDTVCQLCKLISNGETDFSIKTLSSASRTMRCLDQEKNFFPEFTSCFGIRCPEKLDIRFDRYEKNSCQKRMFDLYIANMPSFYFPQIKNIDKNKINNLIRKFVHVVKTDPFLENEQNIMFILLFLVTELYYNNLNNESYATNTTSGKLDFDANEVKLYFVLLHSWHSFFVSMIP